MLKILHSVCLILTISYTCLCDHRQEISDEEYAYIPALFHLDDYDRCMLLGREALFCTFTFELQPLDLRNATSLWNNINKISSDPRNYRHDLLRHGICVPTTCPNITTGLDLEENTISKNIAACYNRKYQHMGLQGNITKITCETTENKYPVYVLDIVVAACFILYIAFLIFASIYEALARYRNKEVYEKVSLTIYGKIIAAFSLPKNWYRLKSLNSSPDAMKLRSIQGIRFYNMICVILCHTLMISFAGPISNTKYTENMTRHALNMFVANGHYAVQTFFLISGWLLSYHFFEMFESKEDINLKYIILIFVNRYIRLTPVLAAMVAFESTWLIHLGKGPSWEAVVAKEYKNCKKNWWTNLLYINNYVNKKEMCLHQTWYIAADTQLFLLSLIVLLIAWKNPTKVKLLFGAVIIAGIVTQGTIAFIQNYDIIIRQYPETLYDLYILQRDDWHDMYSSGHSNITGYIIGLAFGYIFYKYRNKVLATKMIHTILWWVLSFGLCNFIILIAARMYAPNYKSTRLESAFYWAFGKGIFALGMAIGIFGITQKIGWFVRWFCEWESVQVFGRLTYSTYIIHTALIRLRYGYIRSPMFVNDYLMLSMTLGDIVLSYLGGTLLCLCFEMPISALQKLVIPQLKTQELNMSPKKSLETFNYDTCDSINKENISTKV